MTLLMQRASIVSGDEAHELDDEPQEKQEPNDEPGKLFLG
jgi:hypothetical protein